MSSEREFTAGLAARFGAGAGVHVGIGDDAAVVEPRGDATVLSCDPVVAGVHFETDEDPVRVGRKAVLRAVSDLAAMGASADWLLVSVLLPRGTAPGARDALFDGFASAARDVGCTVVGGDVGATPGPLTVTVTAVGHLEGAPLTRAAARVGDSIHVTGPLGGARTGRHLEPRPRLEIGQWLARRTDVRAAIDLSDGLALDLRTLLDAAGCPGAELDADAIPVHADASSLEQALHGGEDYELLFTLPVGAVLPDGGPLEAVGRRPIGRVVGEPGLWLVHADGTREPIAAAGYEHDV